MKEDEKLIFKEQLMGFIKSELIPNYNPKVSEKQHLNNIKCLQEEATKLGNDLLTSGGLKWDVAQKLLNLLLKHYWCLGLIEEPPHCPVDKKLSEQTGMENKVHRSDFISEETYKAVIDAIRKKIEGTDKSIAQWELEIFNEL